MNPHPAKAMKDEVPKKRKIAQIPDKRFRPKEAKYLPEFIDENKKSRLNCRYPRCCNLTLVKCIWCNIFLCCSVKRNCFSKFHQSLTGSHCEYGRGESEVP